MNYSKMKYTDLLKLCRDRNICGYSHKKKAQLIELLEENDWICVSSKHDKPLTIHDIFKPYYDFYNILYKRYYSIYYRLLVNNYRAESSIVLYFLLDSH
jgi:hypothetical protein